MQETHFGVKAQLHAEVLYNPTNIAIKIELCIRVLCGHHLGEIDQDDALVGVHHQVELVEVAVDQATPREANKNLHRLLVHEAWVSQIPNLRNNQINCGSDA